jgi:hypothetical protein
MLVAEVFLALRATVEMLVDSIATTVEPPVDSVAPRIQPALDAVAAIGGNRCINRRPPGRRSARR